jgi:hypothetical protein
MLYSIDSNKYIKNIPHKMDYDRWRSGISDEKYQIIYDKLHSLISGSEIKTSTWIPGKDWSKTVYQPIYEDACQYDEKAAAKFFGLILWHVVMEHEEVWGFGRYKLGNIPIEGLTYFRIDKTKV